MTASGRNQQPVKRRNILQIVASMVLQNAKEGLYPNIVLTVCDREKAIYIFLVLTETGHRLSPFKGETNF